MLKRLLCSLLIFGITFGGVEFGAPASAGIEVGASAAVDLFSFTDDFNRSDNDSLGANWTEQTGDIDIESNAAHHQGGGLSRAIVSSSPSVANGVLSATLDPEGSSFSNCALYFRYTDSNNYYKLTYNSDVGGSNIDLLLESYVSGSGSTVATGALNGFNTSKDIVITFSGTSIVVTADTTEYIDTTDSDHTTGNVGFGFERGTATGICDDFSIQES